MKVLKKFTHRKVVYLPGSIIEDSLITAKMICAGLIFHDAPSFIDPKHPIEIKNDDELMQLIQMFNEHQLQI